MKLTNTKTRYWLAALLLLAALAVSGCGDTGPAATAEDFIKAALDKDCAGMLELSSSQSIGGQSREEAIRECEQSGELTQLFGMMENIKLKDFEVLEEDIRGEEATVKARLVLKVGDQEDSIEQTFLLVLEEGAWKVGL